VTLRTLVHLPRPARSAPQRSWLRLVTRRGAESTGSVGRQDFTGHMLIDDEFLRYKGYTDEDFLQYRLRVVP
jgi:hypothetical protein